MLSFNLVILMAISVVYGGPLCDTMEPICTANSLTFPINSAGGNIEAEPGNDYGCLQTTPDPTWFYLKIATAGDIHMSLSAPKDVDFIVYGPYTDLAATRAECGSISAAEIVDCSFHPQPDELPSIMGAVVDEVYIMLVTNYAKVDQDITLFSLPESTGTTNCAILPNQDCYDTEANNPCTAENIAENGYYFPSCNCCHFIQCDDHGGVFDKTCASGTYWDESIKGQNHNYGECTDKGCTLSSATTDANNPCEPNPCYNGGECIVEGNSFICDCPDDFSGDTCANDGECYDTVEKNPCTAENIAQELFYFASCDSCCRFIQCDEYGQVFDMPCAAGTKWDQNILGQVHNYECEDAGCTLSPAAAVQAIANHNYNPLRQHIGDQSKNVENKSNYYGYIMVIGVIAFILINNLFIGCWCLGKGRNKAHAKFDMVSVNDEI